jgi:cysteine desulfurase
VYLDYAASTPISARAKKAVIQSFKNPANPQSQHDMGVEAGAIVRELKKLIGSCFGLSSSHVVLTPSGTLSNRIAIETQWQNLENPEIFIPFYSHPSTKVEWGVKMPPSCYSSFDGDGTYVTTDATINNLKTKSKVIYVHTTVDPFTGYAIPSCTESLKKHFGNDIGIHVDHVQGFCKFLTEGGYNCYWDSIAISAHKFGGPKGIAAVVFKDASLVEEHLNDYMGTISADLCAGFYVSLADNLNKAKKNKPKALKRYKRFRRILVAAECASEGHFRVITKSYMNNNNSTIVLAAKRIEGCKRDINNIVTYLHENGICVSEVTACTKEIDHEALHYAGFEKDEEAIRVSFGEGTKESDIEALVTCLKEYYDL